MGPSAEVRVPADAKVVDGSGKYAIPGLADMHAHLTAAGEPGGSREFEIPLLLANGVTTVRDMGGYLETLRPLRKEIASGKRLGPQIFFAGPYLDGKPASFPPAIEVTTEEEGAAAVRQLKAEGVDFIKVQSRLHPEAYRGIVEESKRQGLMFVGHVPDMLTALEATNAGQKSIEHLTGVFLGCSRDEEPLRDERRQAPPEMETPRDHLLRDRAWKTRLLDTYDSRKAAELYAAFVRNGTWQVPTLPLLVDLSFAAPGKNWESDAELRYVPASVRRNWKAGEVQSVEGDSGEDAELQARLKERALRTVAEMQRAGVRMMSGTDTPAPSVVPGFSLHEDLEYMVQAGLTPKEALQAATTGPAEYLGLGGQQGEIAAGQRADVVVLEANPLEKIENARRVRAVVVNGALIEREELMEMLARAEKYATNH